MMRKGFLNSDSIELQAYTQFNSKRMDATVLVHGKERQIIQWTHPQLSTEADIEPMFMKMYRQTKQTAFLLLTTNKVLGALEVTGKNIAAINLNNFTCTPLPSVDRYKPYLCKRQIKESIGTSVDSLKTGDLLITEVMATPTSADIYGPEEF